MLTLKTTKSFLKDLKRVSKRGKDINKLETIVDLLQDEQQLPAMNKDHKLSGKWAGHKE